MKHKRSYQVYTKMERKKDAIDNFIDDYLDKSFKPIIKQIMINLLKELYQKGLLTKEYKVFLMKNYSFIKVIDEKKKGVINLYFIRDKNYEISIGTDGFGNDDFEVEMLYLGMDKKDFIKVDKEFIKQELKNLNLKRIEK